ncbi:unnamed protein product, partial [Closterium sp. NIES-54]
PSPPLPTPPYPSLIPPHPPPSLPTPPDASPFLPTPPPTTPGREHRPDSLRAHSRVCGPIPGARGAACSHRGATRAGSVKAQERPQQAICKAAGYEQLLRRLNAGWAAASFETYEKGQRSDLFFISTTSACARSLESIQQCACHEVFDGKSSTRAGSLFHVSDQSPSLPLSFLYQPGPAAHDRGRSPLAHDRGGYEGHCVQGSSTHTCVFPILSLFFPSNFTHQAWLHMTEGAVRAIAHRAALIPSSFTSCSPTALLLPLCNHLPTQARLHMTEGAVKAIARKAAAHILARFLLVMFSPLPSSTPLTQARLHMTEGAVRAIARRAAALTPAFSPCSPAAARNTGARGLRSCMLPSSLFIPLYPPTNQAHLHMTEGAVRAIARRAAARNTGARGLRSLLEGLLTEAMYEVPSSLVEAVVLDEASVGHEGEEGEEGVPGCGAHILQGEGAWERWLQENEGGGEKAGGKGEEGQGGGSKGGSSGGGGSDEESDAAPALATATAA